MKMEAAGPSVRLLFHFLLKNHKQTNHFCKQSNTFHESGGEDHVCADVVSGAGLAGDSLNSSCSKFTNAETCADGGETCTNSCSCNCFHIIKD